jgi:hypothetical protein
MIFIFVSTLLSPEAIKEEVMTFEIHRGKKVVGEVIATKTTYDDRVVYTSHSETTIWILFKISVLYNYNVEYRDGKLYQSDVKIIVNDDLHRQTKIRPNGNQSTFTKYKKDKADSQQLDFDVHYSSIHLLFHEPVEDEASFSEEEGVFHPLKSVGNHTYEKTNTKGRVNTYTYRNGKLDHVFMDAGIFNFQLVRKGA